MTNYIQGQVYHGFTLIDKKPIDEIDSTVYFFKHATLGCNALAIKNKDDNKTFCTAFKTIPKDSTGVAHILEHSVLMGSKKYPVHDVFGEINKGGLMTFLNAMTGADTTWYPFATRNEKEYFNIMDVYCDVTLNPLLERTTFEQEGWHYHLENKDDMLEYSGVVLNEMRGAFSDPIRALFHHTYKSLLPGSTYAHESGGDPSCIPDLTYEDFISFHQSHYHPSNATFFFYGNADLDKELSYIQENFLKDFKSRVARATISPGAPITSPLFVEKTYPVQPGSDLSQKTFLAVSSVIGDFKNKKENTAFKIIAQILYNSDASPLKNAIMNAGLCRDFGGLFLGNSASTIMMTYLIGSDPEKRDRFLDLYKDTLHTMVSQSLEQELVLSELNKFEFSMREEMNKAQRGLDLIGKAIPALKFNLDPFEAIQTEKLLAEIRDDALHKSYFEQLIRNQLLNNPATAIVTLSPDAEKLNNNLEREQKKLSQTLSALSNDQLQGVIDRTHELITRQTTPNSKEILDLLPSLSISDLDTSPEIVVAQEDTLNGCKFIINDLPCSGISYIDFGFDCRSLPVNTLPFLDLFGTIVTEIGTTTRDYIQFTKEINLYTGGFSHSFNTYLQQGKRDFVHPIQWYSVKTLTSNLEKTVDLIADVFSNLNLTNRQRIKEIVQREFGWLEHSVQSEGYSLASSRAFYNMSLAGKYNECINGAFAYQKIKDLAENYDDLEQDFLQTLHSIFTSLFSKNRLIISMTSDSEGINAFSSLGAEIVTVLPETEPLAALTTSEFPDFAPNQAFATSSEVVYNVQGCTLFPDPSVYTGSFEVLKTWISRDYLWNTVRQQGGAYGCFVQFNHQSGNFGMVSYRDPQIEKTYEAYNALAQKISSISIGDSELKQLIIGTYGNFTPHNGPATKGALARNDLLSGITKEFRKNRIQEILATSQQDLIQYARYFERLQSKSYRATIGSKTKIEKADKLFKAIEIL